MEREGSREMEGRKIVKKIDGMISNGSGWHVYDR